MCFYYHNSLCPEPSNPSKVNIAIGAYLKPTAITPRVGVPNRALPLMKALRMKLFILRDRPPPRLWARSKGSSIAMHGPVHIFSSLFKKQTWRNVELKIVISNTSKRADIRSENRCHCLTQRPVWINNRVLQYSLPAYEVQLI